MNKKLIELKFPIGCTEIKFYPKTGVAVAVYESGKEKIKTGDICYSNNGACEMIFIFNRMLNSERVEYFAILINYESQHLKTAIDWCCADIDNIRLATPEESQLLFDKLASQGLKWNAETLELEKIDPKYVPKKGDFVKVTSEKNDIFSIFELDGFNNECAKARGSYITQNGIGIFFGGKFVKELNIFTQLTPEEFQSEFEKIGYIYDFESHTAKKIVKFEKGELCLGRNDDSQTWIPFLFFRIDDTLNYKYRAVGTNGKEFYGYAQCIKFDRKLLGTTNHPKQ